MSTARTTISTMLDTLAARREARQIRMRLERELASYTSPAERAELDAIISRHSADETRYLQDVLARQAA
jgi:hypothetical protein